MSEDVEKLKENDLKWLMERQVDSYLVWIGLWLVCLLGNANILSSMAMNSSISCPKFGVILIVYLCLIGGMVFSVLTVGSIIRDHVLLINKIEDKVLREYILNSRRRLSRFAVNREGKICELNLIILCASHFAVFLSLFYVVLM
jgi:hypothetical protein